ncbi:MAG: flagellar hook-associated protein FlgK [Gemmatimonadaceae bacterium]|jgi:flagellar hook-associated protein 1 FlgK|nr:flagellar hook-associated protein FlgK [Gemmatimonadaceae bacterium]
MSSFGGILSVARSGLLASQKAVTVASNNITNAQTPGYSRQRVVLRTNEPVQLPQGSFGTGVLVDNVERVRDVLLDDTFRQDTASATFSEQRRDTLQAIERVWGEPSETGLAAGLEQFWNAWGDLAATPTSAAARSVVRQRGQQVSQQLNTFAARLGDMVSQSRAQTIETVSRINALAREIGALNSRIVPAESGGIEAPELRDQRDLKVDELASLVGATAIEAPDGSINVQIGGDTIVDGSQVKEIEIRAPIGRPDELGVALVGRGVGPIETIAQVGGRLAAQLQDFNGTIPNAQAAVDEIARALVTEVNAIHRTGFVGADPAGDFFDPAATTASGIRLDAAIAADAGLIAAADTAGESGNNGVALRLSQLRSTTVTVDGQVQTIGAAWRGMVTTTAIGANAADAAAVSSRTLASQTDARRESMKGVSIDEEMVNLMRFQQSYAAAARLISVVDEMSQTLINLGR